MLLSVFVWEFGLRRRRCDGSTCCLSLSLSVCLFQHRSTKNIQTSQRVSGKPELLKRGGRCRFLQTKIEVTPQHLLAGHCRQTSIERITALTRQKKSRRFKHLLRKTLVSSRGAKDAKDSSSGVSLSWAKLVKSFRFLFFLPRRSDVRNVDSKTFARRQHQSLKQVDRGPSLCHFSPFS